MPKLVCSIISQFVHLFVCSLFGFILPFFLEKGKTWYL